MLHAIADGTWVLGRPQRFWGVETGTRMTVVRLRSGGLFVHSPVALDAELQREIEALGSVSAIVAPSLFHHLYVSEWASAFPDALLTACPGLADKRPDVRWGRVLGDDPEPEWRDDLEQVSFSARWLEKEVVFHHPASGTMICADAIFNLASHPSRLTRTVALLLGHRRPGATLAERVIIRDRTAARDQVDRMLAWNADRIVLAHGDMLHEGGREILRDAYRWL